MGKIVDTDQVFAEMNLTDDLILETRAQFNAKGVVHELSPDDISQMTATQNGLHEEKLRGIIESRANLVDPSNLDDLPLVTKRDGNLIVSDGHHRIAAAQLQGKPIKVRFIDEDLLKIPEIGGKMPTTAGAISEDIARINGILEGPLGTDPVFLKKARKRIANLKAKQKRISGVSSPSPKPKSPSDALYSPPKRPTEFPGTIHDLEHVSDLGGSTGAKLVRDPVTGQKFVLKRGASAAHIEEEFIAENAYRAAGARVPKSSLYETPTGPVKLSEYVEDAVDLKKLKATDPERYAKIVKKVENDFAADAALGNWDVVGMEMDNILVGADDIAWRVDVGGSLRYRAQGGLKDVFSEYPTELWSLSKPGNVSAQVFSDTTYSTKVKSMKRLVKKKEKILATIEDPKLRKIVEARIDAIDDTLTHTKNFIEAGWKEEHAGRVMKHRMGLRESGLVDDIPTELAWRDNKLHGKLLNQYDDEIVYADLRAKAYKTPEMSKTLTDDDLPMRFKNYVNDSGGDYNAITNWADSQAGGSWNEEALQYKEYLARKRKGSIKDYYWDSRQKGWARNIESRYGMEAYEEAMAANHAYNYEILQKTKFFNNDQSKGMLRICRTEDSNVISKHFGTKPFPGASTEYPLNVFQSEVGMTRGVAESGSIFKDFYHNGYFVTVQEVEHANVVATFLPGKVSAGNRNARFFLGNSENEAVCVFKNKFHIRPHNDLPSDWMSARTDSVWKSGAKPKFATEDKIMSANRITIAGEPKTGPTIKLSGEL